MKSIVPTIFANGLNGISRSWDSFQRRAQAFGEQSEFARRNSERIQMVGLLLEVSTTTALSGALIGATCGGPKGAAVGAGIGFIAGAAFSYMALEWEDQESLFQFSPVQLSKC